MTAAAGPLGDAAADGPGWPADGVSVALAGAPPAGAVFVLRACPCSPSDPPTRPRHHRPLHVAGRLASGGTSQPDTGRPETPHHEHGSGLPRPRFTPARRAVIVLTGFPVLSLGVPRHGRQGRYQELLPGYPFRSQPEYRKEIRQADGTEPPKPGLPYCAAQWSAVPKLEPGCDVIAIPLESPAQEHHRLIRRVLPAEHRRRERAGHRDALGAPGDGHALTSRRSGQDDAIPSPATCRDRTASAAQKAASSRPTGNPARTHARSTYRPTSRQHRPARVPRGRQGQHRFSTRSGNNRK